MSLRLAVSLRRAFGLRMVATMLVGAIARMPVGGWAQQPDQSGGFTLKVQSDIVLTNVVVRDKKTGEVVKGLKASDLRFWRMGSRRRLRASTIRTSMRLRCCGRSRPSSGRLRLRTW